MLLCWLSLLLIRVAENRTGQTWREIEACLSEVHLSTCKTRDGVVRQRTEITAEQKAILAALGTEAPPLIWAITPKTTINL